jgi:hypothetical protein
MILLCVSLALMVVPQTVVVETWFHDRDKGIDERVVERLAFELGDGSKVAVVRKLEKTILGKVAIPVPSEVQGTRFQGTLSGDGTWRQTPSEVEPQELVRLTRLLFPPTPPASGRSWSATLAAVPNTEVPAASFSLSRGPLATGAWRAQGTYSEHGEAGLMAQGWVAYDAMRRWTEMEWKGKGARLPEGDGTPLSFTLKATAVYKS